MAILVFDKQQFGAKIENDMNTAYLIIIAIRPTLAVFRGGFFRKFYGK